MPQKLIQTQKEEQTQQLSAVQVAMARLLELPVMDLEQRVRNELEDNAALEEAGPDKDEEDMAAETTEADDMSRRPLKMSHTPMMRRPIT